MKKTILLGVCFCLALCLCACSDKAVDPTAAGDSFVGAFCFATCSGMEIEDALCFANHTAALTVSKMGAMPSLPTLIKGRFFRVHGFINIRCPHGKGKTKEL